MIPTYSFYTYKPIRYKASHSENDIRNFIYKFKDGERDAIEAAARIISNKIGSRYNSVFVCIPASSSVMNNKRYEYFSYLVCKSTGMINGFRHIKVNGTKKALHNTTKGNVDRGDYSLNIDDKFFFGKNVIVFDDIITRGYSMMNFSKKLSDLGANVIGGLFLAHTYNPFDN